MGISAADAVRGAVEGIMRPAADIVGEISTKEEQIKLKEAIARIYGQLVERWVQYEAEIARAQSAVIVAEAQGDSWAQRTWRPILMFILMGVIVVWTGMGVARVWWDIPAVIFPEMPGDVWAVLKIGLGGYIAGRSVEKVAKTFKGELGEFGTVAMDHRGQARTIKAKQKAIAKYVKMGYSLEEAVAIVEAEDEDE